MNHLSKVKKVRIAVDYWGLIFGVMLAVSSFFYFYFFARWGFDHIHEGQVLISAKSFSAGAIPHKDFFEYKGLAFPLFMGYFMSLTSSDVLVAKNLNAVLILVNALLMFLIVRKKSKVIATFVPIFWLLFNPAVMLLFSEPWPSHLIIDPNHMVVGLLLGALILSNNDIGKYSSVKYFSVAEIGVRLKLFLAGVLVGLLAWVRIQGLVICALFLFWVYFSRNVTEKRKYGWIFLGATVVNALVFFYLIINGALSFWFEQIVLTPMRVAESSMVTQSSFQTITTLFRFLLMSCVFCFLILSWVILSKLFSSPRSDSHSRFLYPIYTAIFGFVSLTLFVVGQQLKVDEDKDNSITNWIIIIIEHLPYAFWYFSISFVSVFLLTSSFSRLKNRFGVKETKINFSVSRLSGLRKFLLENDSLENQLSFVSIGMIIFLYPNFGNLWSIVLIPSVLSALLVKRVFSLNLTLKTIHPRMKYSFFVLYFGLIVGTLAFSFRGNQEYVYRYSTDALVQIREVDKLKPKIFDHLYGAAESQLKPGSTYFRCGYGLLSFPGNAYLANSNIWGDLVYSLPWRQSSELENSQYLYVCEGAYPDLEELKFKIPDTFILEEQIRFNGYPIASIYRNADNS